MKYIQVILFDNNSGGNIQLNYLLEYLSKKLNYKNTLILFKNKKFFIINFFRFILIIFINIFHKAKYKIIYSDPLLTFLEFLPNSENIIRFIQSNDEELYINHPKMPPILPSFLKLFIKIANKYGKNTIYVCSKLCQDYIYSYRRTSKYIKPTLLISKKEINSKKTFIKTKIISIMSNPILKGIEIYNQISTDFPNYEFIVITNKLTKDNKYKNLEFINPRSRNHLFELLSNSFCHISCSEKETIGLPIYEAMAIKVPSIFKANDSNMNIVNGNLLAFDVYKKEKLEIIFSKCNDKKIRNSIIREQNNLIKQYFNIEYF